VLRDQPELFGPVASTPTAWRVVERIATDPDGLARLRAARAHARARAWAAGGDPDVEVLIIDADATWCWPVLVRSDSAGASTRLAWHLREQGVGFSLGMPIDAHVREAVLAQPRRPGPQPSTATATSAMARRWSS
jgi:hypothetical protein